MPEVEYKTGKASGIMPELKPVQRFILFIAERWNIYVRRHTLHLPAPWSDDPIFQQFRFCNVYREDDRTTMWLAENWRVPNEDDKNFWFASAVARRVNFIASLQNMGYPVPWRVRHFISVMKDRKAAGLQMFGGAYMITTAGSTKEWAQWQAEDVLTPLWDSRSLVNTIKPADSLGTLHAALSGFYGFQSGFISAQIVADVKYLPKWHAAPDWNSFAWSGPGSRRGLNRVEGLPSLAACTELNWHSRLLRLQAIVNVNPLLKKILPHALHAQDLQNCLCEFDKYERARESTHAQRGLRRYDAK